MNMRTPLILEAANKYAGSSPSRFHMPGHKGNIEFCSVFRGAETDITELSFSDSLLEPAGVIAAAQNQIAEVMGAKRSLITTDGSTSGIMAFVYCMSRRGKKIVIARQSHVSVYNAMRIFKMEPVFLPAAQSDGIPVTDISTLPQILKQGDIAGVLLVSPDYYGVIPDLKSARSITLKAGVPLFIDGAHGAHLRFSAPHLYAGNFADAWVDGLHKTMASLNQAALVNINNSDLEEDIAEGLSIFRTTSPSYPIMASAEYGVYHAEMCGNARFRALFEKISEFKRRLRESGFCFTDCEDMTKIVLDCKASDVDGAKLTAYLEERNVYAEMFDGRRMVFMASLFSTDKDLEALARALAAYKPKGEKYRGKPNARITPERAMPFAEASAAMCEWVEIKNAAGRISAGQVGFFPPCYPILTAGDLIDEAAASALAKANNVFGAIRGKIKVVKK